MTTHLHEPDDRGDLPADLVPVARALDRLGEAERSAMPPELPERIGTCSMTQLLAREVSHLDALSTSDRSSASSTLEDRVFMATRAIIASPVRLHAPGRGRTTSQAGRRYLWAGRLALAASVLLAVGLVLPIVRNRTGTPGIAPSNIALAHEITGDLDELAAITDGAAPDAAGRDDVVGLSVALRTVEDALDDDLLKPAIDDGGAL
jgi:hypothetical protein